MNSLTDVLIDLGVAATRRLEVALQSEGIGPTQFRLLQAVAREGGLQPSDLAGLLAQESHSVSGLLNRLEDSGYINRARDRSDRRVVRVTLTPAGREKLAACEQKMHGVEAEIQGYVEGPAVVVLTRLRDSILASVMKPHLLARRKAAST